MVDRDLLETLKELRRLPHETEWVEFKSAREDFGFVKIGQYLSALANEANLRDQPCGWLVFGVEDKSRAIRGSNYRRDPAHLDSLKHEIAQLTGGHTFRDIHVVDHPDGRVVMFEVPPAPRGRPVAFKGHWYGRDGESLVALGEMKYEQIISQVKIDDWSSEICPGASVADLDQDALALARRNFREKNKNRAFGDEVSSWSDRTFLDRARLTKAGGVTRTCLLLLGKGASTHHLEPAVSEITWKLEGEDPAYEHFAPPFLLTTSELYSRIRNTRQKLDVPGQLVPLELYKYDKWVILEALHNAIAHQDYTKQSRITVAERPDRIVIASAGRFFEGRLEDYTISEKMPLQYRNRFLAEAMENVNMIDKMGYGIRRMYLEQRRRSYPLPDYDLSDSEKVTVTVYGTVIDPNYTAILMSQQDLSLKQVILLDEVQKRRNLSKSEAKVLRRGNLVEGRYPNLYVAAQVASATGGKAQYIRNRAFDDAYYKKMILDYIKQYDKVPKKEIEGLLLDKLSDVLTAEQKLAKIQNLLSSMSKEREIRSVGGGRRWHWELNLNAKDEN